MSIKMILGFRPHDASSWVPEVVKTQASQGAGIQEVSAEIERHKVWQSSNGSFEARRKRRMKDRVRALVEGSLHVALWDAKRTQLLDQRVEELHKGNVNPYAVAGELVAHFSGGR
jgi:LAO/AO transport system kinase